MSQSKVALITGASSGIGAATAMEFSRLGWQLAITGRNEERLKDVATKCQAASPKKLEPLAIKADFTDLNQVDDAFEQTIKKFQRIDLLVNNAGYPGQSKRIEEEGFMLDYNNVMTVNLTAPIRLCQLALPHLTKTKGGIINVSSIAGHIAYPIIQYTLSKTALCMLTKILANIVGSSGVRVNTVAPGPILTNLGPGLDEYGKATLMRRAGKPEEVADVISYLASDKSSYIQGSEITVDGGYRVKIAMIEAFYPETNPPS